MTRLRWQFGRSRFIVFPRAVRARALTINAKGISSTMSFLPPEVATSQHRRSLADTDALPNGGPTEAIVQGCLTSYDIYSLRGTEHIRATWRIDGYNSEAAEWYRVESHFGENRGVQNVDPSAICSANSGVFDG